MSAAFQVSDADRIILALEKLGAKVDAVKDALYVLRGDLRGSPRSSRGERLQDGGAES